MASLDVSQERPCIYVVPSAAGRLLEGAPAFVWILAFAKCDGARPRDPHDKQGDECVGSLSVDCPKCKGATLVVSFKWEEGGWFYPLPDQNGDLVLPHLPLSERTIRQFIDSIEALEEKNGSSIGPSLLPLP